MLNVTEWLSTTADQNSSNYRPGWLQRYNINDSKPRLDLSKKPPKENYIVYTATDKYGFISHIFSNHPKEKAAPSIRKYNMSVYNVQHWRIGTKKILTAPLNQSNMVVINCWTISIYTTYPITAQQAMDSSTSRPQRLCFAKPTVHNSIKNNMNFERNSGDTTKKQRWQRATEVMKTNMNFL